jgi:nucleoside-diphosphate-sugar epimerase
MLEWGPRIMHNGQKQWNVLVTGGAGYVGSSLVPKLLAHGHNVTVLDLYIYGEDIFSQHRDNPRLREVKGDIRDPATVKSALEGANAVIHLACISNDPSFELNPDLGKSINYDSFLPLVRASKDAGVKRFIYASSSSVYGVKDEPEVTEELSLQPLTDYSKFKAMCEDVLDAEREPGFVTLTLRPSTVCGYAPRQRLDVVVNILSNFAYHTGKIRVFGGAQKRPNIHIEDMTDLYCFMLQQPDSAINGQVFNAGYENHTVIQLANLVNDVMGGKLGIDVQPTDDMRSYHVSSAKLQRALGFSASHSIEDAVRGLVDAFKANRLHDPMNNPMYFNIKRMQQLALR